MKPETNASPDAKPNPEPNAKPEPKPIVLNAMFDANLNARSDEPETEEQSRKKKVFAIDFETYYGNELNIDSHGLYHYLRDYNSSIYLVGVFSAKEDGNFAYVGKPEAMDWKILDGHTLCAHNARFDRACFERLRELGIVPAELRVDWVCTADMVSALGYGRSLKAAVEGVFGISISKDIRTDMKDRTWQDAVSLGIAEELGRYCLKDAWYCYHLYAKLSSLWSDKERKLSEMTRDMCDYGVYVDQKLLAEGKQKLLRVIDEAMGKIPWVEDGDPVLSPKLLKKECNKYGIPAPVSLAQFSDDCTAWEEEYGDKYPWVGAMRDYRKANTLYKKLITMENRIRPDGTFSYGLKYFGAHTGRWSGDAGFNIQNLPRVPMFGVDLRKMIVPRPGHTFIISDLGQIEQRVLSWLAGDNNMMEELEKGISVYEAHARATMGYTDSEPLKHANPDLYRLAKARVLGLGYGAGANVFVRIAKILAGLDISLLQAKRIVNEFRASNRLITKLWAKLELAFNINKGKPCFTLPLPSGRSIYYRNLAMTPKGMSAEVQGKRYTFFGGKLAENLTSATARDVLGEILLNLDAAGYRVVMHIHDEVVVEVPTEKVDTALKDVQRIMTTTPTWLEGLPLTAETTTSDFYTK